MSVTFRRILRTLTILKYKYDIKLTSTYMIILHIVKVKLCTGCNTSLPVNEFWKNSAAPDGLNYRCKLCRKRADKCRVPGCDKQRQSRQEGYCRRHYIDIVNPTSVSQKVEEDEQDQEGDMEVKGEVLERPGRGDGGARHDSGPTHKVPTPLDPLVRLPVHHTNHTSTALLLGLHHTMMQCQPLTIILTCYHSINLSQWKYSCYHIL